MGTFQHFYELNHAFTPISVIKRTRHDGYGNNPVTFRTLHIFGLRVAYWTTN